MLKLNNRGFEEIIAFGVNSVRSVANTDKVVASKKSNLTKSKFWSTLPVCGGVIIKSYKDEIGHQ